MNPNYIETPAAFWKRLEAEEAARKKREAETREIKARPQYRVASNDEPEPDRARLMKGAERG